MRKIPRRLLNKIVTITKDVQTFSDSGDASNTSTIISADTKMRITKNVTNKSEFAGDELGKFANSTHLGFCDTGTEIDVGYYVNDGAKKYSVDGIDDEPGGVTNHHIQVGMTIVRPTQEDLIE